MRSSLFLAFLFLLSSLALKGQTAPFQLSPLTGPTIDQAEYKWYKLNRVFYKGSHEIDSLKIIPIPSLNRYQLTWYLILGEVASEMVEEAQIKDAKVQLANQGSELLLEWERLREMNPEEEVSLKAVLHNGKTLEGNWIGFKGETLVLAANAKTYRLVQEDLQTLQLLGEYYVPSTFEPSLTLPGSYLIGNSAIPLTEGTIYYQNSMLFMSSIGFAPTENLNMRVGTDIYTLIFSLFSSGSLFTFFVQGTAGYQVGDQLYVGGNLLAGGILFGRDLFGAGLAYGTLTLGNPDHHATLGIGWGASNEGLLSPIPMITFAGQTRIGKRVSLVAENWYISTDQGESTLWTVALGCKVFSKNLEFAGAMALSGFSQWEFSFTNSAPIPYLTLTYRIH